jgi:hypothetical protein
MQNFLVVLQRWHQRLQSVAGAVMKLPAHSSTPNTRFTGEYAITREYAKHDSQENTPN